ncbi:MAG: hypothetical protein IJW49_07960 [Clostridia bacterium]|nr:hypothetical protein [Clostridia bacterium]
MRKIVAFLLCLSMLLSLSSCFSADDGNVLGDLPDNNQNQTENSGSDDSENSKDTDPSDNKDSLEDEEDLKDTEDEKTPSDTTIRGRFYKVEDLDSLWVKYYLYNAEGEEVLSEDARKSFQITAQNDYLLQLCFSSPTRFSRFYDVKNDRFSEDYPSVVAHTNDRVAYLEKNSESFVLVVKSIFDDSYRREYALNSLRRVQSWRLPDDVLFLSYKGENEAETVAVPLYEGDSNRFVDYGTIVRLAYQMCYALYYYDEQTDYCDVFGITDAQQSEWFDALLSSMLSFYTPQSRYLPDLRYSVKDLNCDGTFELILLRDDYEILAIFSMADGKPILLETFWEGKNCCIDHNGLIYTYKNNVGFLPTRRISRIAAGGASLEFVAEFGVDGSEAVDDVTAGSYYKIENGQKVSITVEEYRLIASQFVFPHCSSTKDCANLTVTSIVDFYLAIQACTRQAFIGVLENRIKVFDTARGEYCYLKDCTTPYSKIPLTEIENLGYARIDLNSDGVTEMVIDCGDALILRYYEGTVYLYPFTFREMELHADGTYSWSHNGEDFVYGESRITFEGEKLQPIENWRIVNDGEPNAEYYLNGIPETREYMLQFLEKYPTPKKVEYTPLDLSWERNFTSTEAIEIAKEYWNFEDGREDAACGTSFVAYATLYDKPYDEIEYYHVVIQSVAYYRYGSDIESPYYDGPYLTSISYVRVTSHLLVNAKTGESKTYTYPSHYGK